MSEQVRYHQVYQIKIIFEEGNNIMTVLGDEQIYEERNAQGSAPPPNQVFVREEEESSGDESPRISDRIDPEDRPPVQMPRGTLLSPEEAERHRGLFERERRERELFIRGVVQRLRPRVILLGRRKYLLQLYQDDVPSTSSENVEIEFTLERESSSSSSSSSSTSTLSSTSSEDDSSDLDDSDSSDSSDSSDNDDPEEGRGAQKRRRGSQSSEDSSRGKRRKMNNSSLTINSSDSSDED